MKKQADDNSDDYRDSRTVRFGLPVAPSMEPALRTTHLHSRSSPFTHRHLKIFLLALLLGAVAGIVAQVLTILIGLITNLAFYGRVSTELTSPAENQLGLWVLVVPVVGAIIVGLMARYGSRGIRGHGIPEAMEQVLLNQSRIPPRLTFLKPLSAAIAIGTGGPFGAEGPIIATGGALGSFLGQVLHITADERKTLLAAGAAAGMAATFGTPISAVLLAIELLLFEFRARSIIAVALACISATGVHMFFEGSEPVFAMGHVEAPVATALFWYLCIGSVIGVLSVLISKALYLIEDLFERLPIHWMWWPAIGAVAVGVVGFIDPRTLGVGYNNITDILSGQLAGEILIFFFVLKFLSWSISLGSGTSGGTLAPLLTIGGGIGAVLGGLILAIAPASHIDIHVAALVGMAALFAGASRALLASVVFAFEATVQPFALLPLLAGCSMSYLVSSLLMKESIMTEKIARRGVQVPSDYSADFLAQIKVRDIASSNLSTINGSQTVESIRQWITSNAIGTEHHVFPVVDNQQQLLGVTTWKDIFTPMDAPATHRITSLLHNTPAIVYDDGTLLDAVEIMAESNSEYLVVVSRVNSLHISGILTWRDVMSAYKRQIRESNISQKSIRFDRQKDNLKGN